MNLIKSLQQNGDSGGIKMATLVQKRAFAKEFEHMRDMAELRALSNISLTRPLTKREMRKVRVLRKRVGI